MSTGLLQTSPFSHNYQCLKNVVKFCSMLELQHSIIITFIDIVLHQSSFSDYQSIEKNYNDYGASSYKSNLNYYLLNDFFVFGYYLCHNFIHIVYYSQLCFCAMISCQPVYHRTKFEWFAMEISVVDSKQMILASRKKPDVYIKN